MNKNFGLAIACMLATVATAHSQIGFNASRFHHEYVLQDEEDEDYPGPEVSGFSFGLNLGSYFGSSTTANFYNGSGAYGAFVQNSGVRSLTIAERLDASVFLQDMQYINTYYNSSAVEVPFDSSPINMRYNPTLLVGLQMKYNLNRNAAFVFNLDAIRLKAVDRYSLRFIGTPAQVNSQQDVRLFQITGTEQRLIMNLGYRQGFEIGVLSNFYLQFGGTFLGTKVIDNEIAIADRTLSLYQYTSNINTQVAFQAPTGVGFGYYISPGWEIFMNEKYSFDFGFTFSRDQMKLVNYAQRGWNKMFTATFTI